MVGREGIKKLVKYIRKIGLFHGIYKMKRTKETTSKRRKDMILNMEKTESRIKNLTKKRTEG
jgi:hypothetical protein